MATTGNKRLDVMIVEALKMGLGGVNICLTATWEDVCVKMYHAL